MFVLTLCSAPFNASLEISASTSASGLVSSPDRLGQELRLEEKKEQTVLLAMCLPEELRESQIYMSYKRKVESGL